MEASTQQQGGGQWQPGWYEYPHGGGRRYWDGRQWTDHFVPPAEAAAAAGAGAEGPLDFGRTVLAVWAGFVLGWGTIFLGSKLAEDEIYWPVKAATEEVEPPPVTVPTTPTPEGPGAGS